MTMFQTAGGFEADGYGEGEEKWNIVRGPRSQYCIGSGETNSQTVFGSSERSEHGL